MGRGVSDRRDTNRLPVWQIHRDSQRRGSRHRANFGDRTPQPDVGNRGDSMIGHANIFESNQTMVLDTPDHFVDITPVGDMPGFYWGAVRAMLDGDGGYDNNLSISNNGIFSQLMTIEVGGIEVFRVRHINRNWWFPIQYYQISDWINQQQQNYRWRSQVVQIDVSNPAGFLIGAWTLGATGPLRSYQHAFFEPAQIGPAAAPLPFTVGNIPRTATRILQANGEWVYFTFYAGPGQTIRIRNRDYIEVPNPALNPPISDTPPGLGQNAEPDEVLVSNTPVGIGQGFIEGWIVRTGLANETLLPIASIDAGVDGGIGLQP